MKFLIKKVSDWEFQEERDINTIEDLKELEKEHDGWFGQGEIKEFIVNFGNDETPAEITIYDDFIE